MKHLSDDDNVFVYIYSIKLQQAKYSYDQCKRSQLFICLYNLYCSPLVCTTVLPLVLLQVSTFNSQLSKRDTSGPNNVKRAYRMYPNATSVSVVLPLHLSLNSPILVEQRKYICSDSADEYIAIVHYEWDLI